MGVTKRSLLLWIGTCYLAGIVVSIIGHLILSAPTPGASLIAGFIIGVFMAKRYQMRTLLRSIVVIGCSIVGLLGWLDTLPFTH